MNYYAVVFLLRPPDLLRREPLFGRTNVCNSQENGVRTRCAAIVNHSAIVNSLHVVNLLRRSIFSTAGSFGWKCRIPSGPKLLHCSTLLLDNKILGAVTQRLSHRNCLEFFIFGRRNSLGGHVCRTKLPCKLVFWYEKWFERGEKYPKTIWNVTERC